MTNCRRCKKKIENRRKHAKYCEECADKIAGQQQRKAATEREKMKERIVNWLKVTRGHLTIRSLYKDIFEKRDKDE